MEHVDGRIFKDQSLPDKTPEERRQIYAAMIEVLAKIHSVNLKDAGIDNYGKQGTQIRVHILICLQIYFISNVELVCTLKFIAQMS